MIFASLALWSLLKQRFSLFWVLLSFFFFYLILERPPCGFWAALGRIPQVPVPRRGPGQQQWRRGQKTPRVPSPVSSPAGPLQVGLPALDEPSRPSVLQARSHPCWAQSQEGNFQHFRSLCWCGRPGVCSYLVAIYCYIFYSCLLSLRLCYFFTYVCWYLIQ